MNKAVWPGGVLVLLLYSVLLLVVSVFPVNARLVVSGEKAKYHPLREPGLSPRRGTFREGRSLAICFLYNQSVFLRFGSIKIVTAGRYRACGVIRFCGSSWLSVDAGSGIHSVARNKGAAQSR